MTLASCTSKLESFGIDIDELEHLISHAFKEDMPEGDDKTTIATIDATANSKAVMRARKDGVLAGVCVAALVFEKVGIKAIDFSKECGDLVKAGESILSIEGNTREILRSERIALNFISHLSGIATLTKSWVKAIEGTGALIRDTRKTTPGLRNLEKFAVRMGGGHNHRMNLSDGAIIKDNHIAASGSITSAVEWVLKGRAAAPPCITCSIGVSTSTKPALSKVERSDFKTWGRIRAVSRASGRTIKST